MKVLAASSWTKLGVSVLSEGWYEKLKEMVDEQIGNQIGTKGFLSFLVDDPDFVETFKAAMFTTFRAGLDDYLDFPTRRKKSSTGCVSFSFHSSIKHWTIFQNQKDAELILLIIVEYTDSSQKGIAKVGKNDWKQFL